MRSDKELLELAAKAAGVFMTESDWPFSDPFDPSCLNTTYNTESNSITGTRLWYGQKGEIGGTCAYTWIPFDISTGDALRLAVKLNISIRPDDDCCFVDYRTVKFMESICEIYEGSNAEASTCHAIVRAAAEIGASL